jgi:hypothetical protein
MVATLLMAAACETAPPVQEMSDARQAIAVAREAGAEELAAAELAAAEQYLKRARQALNEHHYAEARQEALQAIDRAINAQRVSESATADED